MSDYKEKNHLEAEEQSFREEMGTKGEDKHNYKDETHKIAEKNKETELQNHIENVNDTTSDKENKDDRTSSKRKFWGSKAFTAVISGIVSSILTLAFVLYTPFFQEKGIVGLDEHTKDQENAISTQEVTTVSSESSIVEMVETASKGIVGIVKYGNEANPFHVEGEGQSGVGSGVIFKKEGKDAYIVTNNHVIENADRIEVSLESGEHTTAKLVGADALTDLAVLKIDGSLVETTLEFGDSDLLKAGEEVVAIGNPLGLEFSRTVTRGIVSAIDRTVNVNTSAGQWELNVIQTDAAINPGNSGGALLNNDGKVIGVNSLKISTYGVEGLGFAIPSNDVVPVVEQLMEHGKIERPFIGISMADLERVPRMYVQEIPEKVTEGVIVTDVTANSAAEKAGIQPKDVIVEINGNEIKNGKELRKLLYTKLEISDVISVKLYREDEMKTVQMTLTSNPT